VLRPVFLAAVIVLVAALQQPAFVAPVIHEAKAHSENFIEDRRIPDEAIEKDIFCLERQEISLQSNHHEGEQILPEWLRVPVWGCDDAIRHRVSCCRLRMDLWRPSGLSKEGQFVDYFDDIGWRAAMVGDTEREFGKIVTSCAIASHDTGVSNFQRNERRLQFSERAFGNTGASCDL
jgi:hypothetical protein